MSLQLRDRNQISPLTPIEKISKMLEKFYNKKELPQGFIESVEEKKLIFLKQFKSMSPRMSQKYNKYSHCKEKKFEPIITNGYSRAFQSLNQNTLNDKLTELFERLNQSQSQTMNQCIQSQNNSPRNKALSGKSQIENEARLLSECSSPRKKTSYFLHQFKLKNSYFSITKSLTNPYKRPIKQSRPQTGNCMKRSEDTCCQNKNNPYINLLHNNYYLKK